MDIIAGYGEIGKSIASLYYNNISNTSNVTIITLDDKGEYTTFKKGEPLNTLKDGISNSCSLVSLLERLVKLSNNTEDVINVLHISFPYTDKFVSLTDKYIRILKPKLTVIHSTVDIGITRKIYNKLERKYDICHSPVIGRHPDLTESLITFRKLLSGSTPRAIGKARKLFRSLDITPIEYSKLEETEAAKMLSTTYYAHCLSYMRHVHKFCQDNNLDFNNVYTLTNKVYNDGYSEMDFDQFVRPVLEYMPGKTGGHCLVPNMKILKNKFPRAKQLLAEEKDATLHSH